MSRELKRSEMNEILNAPAISAIEALRRNLLYAMIRTVTTDDMTAIVAKQVEQAKNGSAKSAKLVMDMLAPDSRPARIREDYLQEQGGVIDYKVEIRKLVVCLIAFNGPQSTEDVAGRLHLSGAMALDALMCGWFTRDGGKWALTNEARQKVLDVGAHRAALVQEWAEEQNMEGDVEEDEPVHQTAK